MYAATLCRFFFQFLKLKSVVKLDFFGGSWKKKPCLIFRVSYSTKMVAVEYAAQNVFWNFRHLILSLACDGYS